MMVALFDQEKVDRDMQREIAREARAEGLLLSLISLVQDGILNVEQASQRANMSTEEFIQIAKENGYTLSNQ